MRRFLLVFILPLCLAPALASADTRHSAPPPASGPRADIEKRSLKRLLNHARELQGTPYSWGGASEKTGFDCSGLLVYLFRQEAGLKLPRTTRAMIDEQHVQVQRRALKPGDAVFFSRNGSRRVNHVGLYLGDGRFIHAPSTGKRVRIDSLKDDYWDQHYRTARRFRL